MEKISVIFLTLPDSIKEQEKTFRFDPSIPLPIELEPGKNNLEKLSLEMILSGMLKIISTFGSYCSSGDPEGFRNPLDPFEAGFKSGDILEIEAGGTNEKAIVPLKWIDYYRNFVFTVRPEIYHELTGASIIKARNGEFDIALEINAILEGLFPGSPGVFLNKALILENRAKAAEKNGHHAGKENAEARKAYETALSLEPVLPDTLFNAAYFYMHIGEYKLAKECFSRYVSGGEEAEIQAEFQPEKKKEAQKIINYIKSQGLDDNNYREAYDYINNGNNEKGLEKIRDYIGKYPKVWNGWFVLGWALRKLGRFADGLEAFKKAEELSSGEVSGVLGGAGSDLKNEMAICLMELGELKDARKELESALREEPENLKSISNLGVLAMKAGNADEAAAFFRTVLGLDPDDPLAKHFLGKD